MVAGCGLCEEPGVLHPPPRLWAGGRGRSPPKLLGCSTRQKVRVGTVRPEGENPDRKLFRTSSLPSTARAHKRAHQGAVHTKEPCTFLLLPDLPSPRPRAQWHGREGIRHAAARDGAECQSRECPPARRVAVAAGAPAASTNTAAEEDESGLTSGFQASPQYPAAAVFTSLPPRGESPTSPAGSATI